MMCLPMWLLHTPSTGIGRTVFQHITCQKHSNHCNNEPIINLKHLPNPNSDFYFGGAVYRIHTFVLTDLKAFSDVILSLQQKIRVPESELCQACRKRVYPMESLIADKQNFHKSCFRCAHCSSQLR